MVRDYLDALRRGEAEPQTEYSYVHKPYEHQRVGFEYLRLQKNVALFFEQGTGKTKTVIDYLDWLIENSGDKAVLIVAPKGVVSTWKSELGVHSRSPIDCVVLGGGSSRIKRILKKRNKREGIYIIGYESLRACKQAGLNLAKKEWDLVVADESTRIKHRGSKQSRAMHDFPKFCPSAKRVLLSGMPITNSPLDIFSQYLFLEPAVFGNSWWDFQARYAQLRKRTINTHSFQEIVGYRNLDELRRKMHSVAVRYKKSECLDLPPKIYQKRKIPWAPRHRKAYNEMAKDLIATCAGQEVTASNVLAKMAKMREICNGWVYDDNGIPIEIKTGNAKLNALVELMEEIDGSVIIWCEFSHDIDRIEQAFAKEKIPTCCIRGGMEAQHIGNEIQCFQDGKARAIIVQSRVGAEGLTLTKASHAIYFSNSFSIGTRQQSEDRCHRIGQLADRVVYIDLCMEDSIDEAVVKAQRLGLDLATSINDWNLPEMLKGNYDGSRERNPQSHHRQTATGSADEERCEES